MVGITAVAWIAGMALTMYLHGIVWWVLCMLAVVPFALWQSYHAPLLPAERKRPEMIKIFAVPAVISVVVLAGRLVLAGHGA